MLAPCCFIMSARKTKNPSQFAINGVRAFILDIFWMIAVQRTSSVKIMILLTDTIIPITMAVVAHFPIVIIIIVFCIKVYMIFAFYDGIRALNANTNRIIYNDVSNIDIHKIFSRNCGQN